MKIIQIRGINGSGKSTVAREYIENGHFVVREQSLAGSQYSYCYDGETAIIGRYDVRECGGVDGEIRDGDELKNLIVRIAKEVKPETLVFEGIMYGKSFQFSYDIHKWAKAMGHKYIALCLMPSFDEAMLRVWNRNGGKPVNVEALENGYRACIKSNSKLRAMGVDVRIVDTGNIPKGEMWRVIEEVI